MAKYIKGLIKDTGPIDQPEGSYRYAKNALISKTKGAIVNEHGNSSYASIGSDKVILGAIEVTDGRVIVFAVTDSGASIGRSSIYVIENGNSILILRTNAGDTPGGNDFDLKFDKDNPIEGAYKIDPDGNLIIYWTDNFNPPRSLNVTRQEQESNVRIYGVNPIQTPNKNYIDRLNLFPHAGPVPKISFSEIANGGALKSGVYYLFLAYVDQNFTQTNYVAYSLGVPIVEDDESVRPIERYDGCPNDSQTGKSIVWNISNLNTDYEYLRPIVVSRSGDAEFAYKLNDIDISDDTGTIVFSMLEGYESASVEDTILDTVAYDTAKTITQLDGVLYIGNLTGSSDIGYQPNANYIKLSTIVETLNPFDSYQPSLDNLEFGYLDTEPPASILKTQGFRDIDKLSSTTGNRRGYTRDEVYAFYIAFVLNNGSMSYAYHIPGREKLEDVSANAILKVGSAAQTGLLGNTFDEDDSITGGIDPDLRSLTQHQGKLFHFYDFSAVSSYSTNYWENKNELYPITDNFKVFNGIAEVDAANLGGQSVRHHRMPTNQNVERQLITDSIIGNQGGGTTEEVTTVYAIVWGGDDGQSSDGWLDEVGGNSPPILDFPDSAIFPTGNISSGGMSDTFDGGNGFTNGILYIEEQTGVWDDNWNYGSYPEFGQQGVLVWFKNTANEGAGWCEIQEDTADALYISQGLGYAGTGNEEINAGFGNVEFACFVWWDTVTVPGGGEDPVTHKVQPLGVRLSDIKIPQDIAKKVQGFRIYYAERNHANRRILGQDLIKNTKSDLEWEDADLGGCGDNGGEGATEAFILAPGTLYNGEVNTAVFHDNYLLESRKSLVPATHTTHEYSLSFLSYQGAGHHYVDVDSDDCQAKASFVSFHLGANYTQSQQTYLHYPLREKCKTYIQGDSIYDGRALGFGKRIYNLGGESSILLGYKINRLPNLGSWTEPGQGASWHATPPGPLTPFSFADENSTANAVAGQIHNLQAFKTDMYLSFDTQELVWTGYEVLGDDLDNFVLNDNGTAPHEGQSGFHNFGETGDIWGGDTFICRHGYRITHRPEISDVDPNDHKCTIYTICESSVNINFRHETDVDSTYFPGSPAKKILDVKANIDLTHVDNMKYASVYSLGVADIKPPIPLPLRASNPSIFKTRVQRSAESDPASLIDNYRVFLALQYKDLPRNKGDLWKLITFNNLLYLHTEDSLFKTKGKQSMQMGDASEAFVGSGDIFKQEPDEMVQTESGYGGTNSQWVATVTRHGYFCLDYVNTKVFLVKDKIYDIGKTGLSDWFKTNIPYALDSSGLPQSFDNPIQGIGFHAVWDEQNGRILLTKKDLVPTKDFLELIYTTPPPPNTDEITWDSTLNQFISLAYTIVPGDVGDPIVVTLTTLPLEWSDTKYFTPTGWTVSYDPELNIWVSFHDYVPYLYSYTDEAILSVSALSSTIWEHSDIQYPGRYYNTIYPFEFEFIYNAAKDNDKVFYSFNYIADISSDAINNQANVLLHDPGFTSFYVYTTHQISAEQELEYMMNIRRIGNEWKINKFRDLADLTNNTSTVYTGGVSGHDGSNFGITGVNVAGTVTQSVETTTINTMFNIDGMSETINTNFIDLAKSWNKQKKFSDKWVGIRLIASNSNQNLINLYATDVAAKKFYR